MHHRLIFIGQTPFGLPRFQKIVPCTVSFLLLFGSIGMAKILDGGVDSANLGKGEWIYYVEYGTNHMSDTGAGKEYVASVKDVPSMMAYMHTNMHLQFVVVKAGNGATVFPSAGSPQFTSTLVNAAHAEGLKIFGYTRSFGTNLPGELAIVTNVFNAGGDGFIFDAEGEWVTNLGNKAASNAWWLCSTFKTNWPNKFLAHAPAADIQYRYGNPPSFPYKEFGYWCDVAMPQDYWHSWGLNANVNVNQYGTPATGIQWMDSSYTIWENSLASAGNSPNGDSWTNAIKPLAPIASADAPGGTNVYGTLNQDFASITNWVYLLKTDTSVPALGGYKGCCFFRVGLQDTNNILAGIAAATIGTTTNSPPPTNNVSDIIIDNLDAGFSTTGSWSTNSSSGDKWASDYRYVSATSGPATATATWTPNILTAGNYDVYVWYPEGTNRTTNAPYAVFYNGGTASSNVNQRANGGTWLQVASKKSFLKGTSGNVRLGNNASTNVVMADAVKFSYSAVQPISMSFDSIAVLTNGRIHLHALSSATNFFIEGSSNLISWQTLTNGTVSSNSVDYLDPMTNGPLRFYRGRFSP